MGAADTFAYGVTLFAAAIVVLVGYTMFSMMQTTLTTPGIEFDHNYTLNGTTINPADTPRQFFNAIDWIIIFLAVMLAVGMFIAGYILPSHPIFTVIGILLAFVWLWISPFLRNAYLQILQLPVLSDAATKFPMMNALILNLPLVGLVVGVIAAIMTYGKSGGGNQI